MNQGSGRWMAVEEPRRGRSVAALVAAVAVVASMLAMANAPQAQAAGCPNPYTYSDSGAITVNGVSGCQQTLRTGETTWAVPAGVTSVDVLVVGAGGGGGAGQSAGTSGVAGGAGGSGGETVLDTNYAVTPGGSITVSIGTGGSRGNPGTSITGGNGGSTAFGTITATGGAGGGGASGGSPGSAGSSASVIDGISSTTTGGSSSSICKSAGGGAGAGADGVDAAGDGAAGTGGVGYLPGVGLFAQDYGLTRFNSGAGGGGGAGPDASCSNVYTPAPGGDTGGGSGGGAGTTPASPATDTTIITSGRYYGAGGGGGGAQKTSFGGSVLGGSGTDGGIIIRWLVTSAPSLVNFDPSDGSVNQPSTYTFTASGYPAPTFAVTSGSLPTGLALGTGGVLSGTPTSTGSYSFTVTATNSVSSDSEAVSMDIRQTPAFTASSPPATGLPNAAYAGYTFAATGYPAPTFARQTGSLPTGLALTSDGRLSGTPTTAGSYTFTVRATNSAGTIDTGSIVIVIGVAPAFTADAPPATGSLGTAFAGYTFAASGNPSPTFAVRSGSLPPGLTLGANSGVLSGTPTAGGLYSFTVRATNGAGTADTGTLTITVAEPPAGPGSQGIAWGDGYWGGLGNGSTQRQTRPVEISDGANGTGQWKAVSGGDYSSCGIGLDDSAYCWGANDEGELGNASTSSSLVPVRVSNGANATGGWKAVGVGGGDEWACGLGKDDRAYCWGANGSDGYLGIGNFTTANSTTPLGVVNGANATGTWKSLAVGYYHTCGVGSDDSAYCWGYDSYGNLGDGSGQSNASPVAVVDGANSGGTWKAVSAGYYMSCGIGGDDKAYCWGYNSDGQLGNGDVSYTDALTPVAVSNGANATGTWKALAAGYYRTCGIGGDDSVYCWGYYPTGYGSNTSTTPQRVSLPGDPAVSGVASATASYSSCAIADDTVYCWGENGEGQMGNGTTVDAPSAVSVWSSGVLSGGVPVGISMGGENALLVATFPYAPSAPTITGITPVNGGASVAFTPGTPGSSATTNYEYRLDGGPWQALSPAGTASPLAIAGLVNGQEYAVEIRAVSGDGDSAASNSLTVTPRDAAPPEPALTPPGAPRDVRAVAGDASAQVSWLAPADPGASPIGSYRVTSVPQGGSCAVYVPALSCSVTGLANGVSYTFTVSAANQQGFGDASARSNAVTPTGTMPQPDPQPLPRPLAPGDSLLQVDGRPDSNVQVTPKAADKVLQVTGDDWSMDLSGLGNDGKPLDLGLNGVLRLENERDVATQGAGFLPNSRVELYVDPPVMVTGSARRSSRQAIYVGTVRTDASGSFEGTATLPTDISPGEHVLQAVGYSPTAQTRAMSLGVLVDPWIVLDKGTRVADGRHDRIRANGSTGGIAAGIRLTPWIRYDGQSSFTRGKAAITVQADGSFRWTREIRKSKGVIAYVSYVETESQRTESNRVVWAKVG